MDWIVDLSDAVFDWVEARRARRATRWDVREGAMPGEVIVLRPGYQRPPGYVIDVREVHRPLVNFLGTGGKGWQITGNPTSTTLTWRDGTTTTYPVSLARMIDALDAADARRDAATAPPRPARFNPPGVPPLFKP